MWSTRCGSILPKTSNTGFKARLGSRDTHLLWKTSFSPICTEKQSVLWSEVTDHRSTDQVNTAFVKSSGHHAIHLAGPPTEGRLPHRPVSSQQRLVAWRLVAPPWALCTVLVIKVIDGVSVAKRGARHVAETEAQLKSSGGAAKWNCYSQSKTACHHSPPTILHLCYLYIIICSRPVAGVELLL